MYIYIYIFIFIYVHAVCIYIYVFMYMCIHTYIHTCMHACIHAYIHTYIHTYMYIYIFIYLFIYTYTHVCVRAHLYTGILHIDSICILGGPCDSNAAAQRSGRQPSRRALQRSDPRGGKEANPVRNLDGFARTRV